MSAPRTTGPEAPAEKKRGLSRFMLSRVKSVFQRGDSSKRQSIAPKAAPVATSSKATGPSVSKPAPATETAAPSTQRHTVLDHEKARRLAEKYDIDLGPQDWKPSSIAERVEKPIRMRIHRTCHKCKTSFGSNKVCSSCQHVRCDQCPRYPKKRAAGDKGKGVQSQDVKRGPAAGVSHDIEGLKRKHRYVLTIPSKTGGQDLVRKKPTQRVRRTCHLCSTVYQSGSKTCSKCDHIRCTDCPRDPPKPRKYPDGYPGDVLAPEDEPDSPSRIYKRPARYHCHMCNNIIKTGETCSNCGHTKCADCPRVSPKKFKPEPDPDVVRRVRERLEVMAMTAEPPKG